MKHRIAIAGAWIAATLASILVAMGGVASVSTAIAEPGSFQIGAEVAPATDPPPSTPTTTTPSSRSSSASATTDTRATTTTSNGPATSTSSTNSETGETTVVKQSGKSNTYEIEGGWVTIRTDENGVYLESASPQSGWSIKVESQGPEEVVVVFKSHEHETHFKAKLDKGQVRVSIEEDEGGEGD